MKISILAIAALVPVASAFVAPQVPAFSTQLQSSTIPQASQSYAPPAAWTPPAAAPATPPVPAAGSTLTAMAAAAGVDEERGQPLQVYEQIDRAQPGQWWKGAYSNDNIARAGHEGYPSNRSAIRRSSQQPQQQQSSAIMRSVGSKPQARQGRTWWMGVEGGIGYCQGGP